MKPSPCDLVALDGSDCPIGLAILLSVSCCQEILLLPAGVVGVRCTVGEGGGNIVIWNSVAFPSKVFAGFGSPGP